VVEDLSKLPRHDAYKKDNCIIHKPCGGQVMVDASVTRRLPTGFGDKGDGRFSVDYVVYKYWRGTCLSCDASGLFRPPGVKHETRRPAGINRKLSAMRRQG